MANSIHPCLFLPRLVTPLALPLRSDCPRRGGERGRSASVRCLPAAAAPFPARASTLPSCFSRGSQKGALCGRARLQPAPSTPGALQPRAARNKTPAVPLLSPFQTAFVPITPRPQERREAPPLAGLRRGPACFPRGPARAPQPQSSPLIQTRPPPHRAVGMQPGRRKGVIYRWREVCFGGGRETPHFSLQFFFSRKIFLPSNLQEFIPFFGGGGEREREK